MTHSQRKGAVGEREWAGRLRAYGWEAHRGQQYSGLEGEDVVSNLPFHHEVKRVQRLSIDDALDQAIRDATWKTPIVAHRKNHTEWKVTLRADDFLEMLPFMDMEEYEKYIRAAHVRESL